MTSEPTTVMWRGIPEFGGGGLKACHGIIAPSPDTGPRETGPGQRSPHAALRQISPKAPGHPPAGPQVRSVIIFSIFRSVLYCDSA